MDLAHPLVTPDGAWERRPDGVDALDAVDVGGVDGRRQHPDADVAVAEVDGRHIRHPEHLVGGAVLVVEHGLGRRRGEGGGGGEAGGAAAAENLQGRRKQPGRRRHGETGSVGASPLLAFLPSSSSPRCGEPGPIQPRMMMYGGGFHIEVRPTGLCLFLLVTSKLTGEVNIL